MKKILFITAIIIIAFTACKKSSVETSVPAVPTHLGLWKGRYSISTTTQPTQDVYLLLSKDGAAKVYNGADTATAIQKSEIGGWALNGQRIIVTYSFVLGSLLSMNFYCDENFTKSIALNTADVWGTGNYLGNTFVQKGCVTFTKP
jgi:hypothetical protein